MSTAIYSHIDTELGYEVPDDTVIDITENITGIRIIADNKIIDAETLTWEEYELEPEEGYEEYYDPDFKGKRITLGEISRQLRKRRIKGVIYVWVEDPLIGVIYQHGNYDPKEWVKHGITKGYA